METVKAFLRSEYQSEPSSREFQIFDDYAMFQFHYGAIISEELASLNFRGKWWAKGCTDEAIFSLKSDYDLFINQLKIIKR